ncbi:MAG: acetate--CoA ligase family protein [Caldiserica bacterium]|jgi:acetyltransferase|nr:acetate--CoA ligase family protein [Caldisericota bacterium]MDH7562353.1 acetate--CoA ligase family protein [Caldisericota bacterium]
MSQTKNDITFPPPPKNLKSLLSPSSIAVVGASESPGAGLNVVENLLSIGYKGKIFPVNPRRSKVLGFPCFPDLLSIPDEVEMVAIVLSAEKVLPVLKEGAQKGVRAAWAFASGFSESGEEGKKLQEEISLFCREKEIQFCGPNCVGLVNLSDGFAAFSAPLNQHLKKGSLGAIVQSGSVCLALTNSNRGLGFSKIISTGNEAVLDATQYMDFLLDDPETKTLALFIESFRRPEALEPLARKARETRKPVILVKVGRSELAQRATAAHTGALAGSDQVYDAALKKMGFIRVNDLDELLETSHLLLSLRENLPSSNKIAMLTVSGGEIGLIADLSEGKSFSYCDLSLESRTKLKEALPPYTSISNPLDAWGSGDLERTYPPSMEILATEADVSMLIVSLDATADLAPRQTEQYLTIARAASSIKKSHHKPIAFFSNVSGGFDPQIRQVLEDSGIPFLQGTRESLNAVEKLIWYSAFLKREKLQIPQKGNEFKKAREILQSKKGFLKEREAKEILELYGIKSPKEFIVKDLKEAQSRASFIGYPVVLKVHSEKVLHKTEAGGVILNIQTPRELEEAFLRISRAFPQEEEFLISQMLKGEVAEAILGISPDPSFGPVLVFGSGGILVELLKDSSLRLPPVDFQEAMTMVQETKLFHLISGFRGKRKGDLQALCQAIVGIGRLTLDFKDRIKALDINPLFIMPEGNGVFAVDALMELR